MKVLNYLVNTLDICGGKERKNEIMEDLTEEDKVLLMCAFEVSNLDCNKCINHNKCQMEIDKSFYEMGQDLLIKMGIIKEQMVDWH